jgi:hypothetical protein
MILWGSSRSEATVFAPEWLDLSRSHIVISNKKLKGVGWEPKHMTTEAFLGVPAASGEKDQV